MRDLEEVVRYETESTAVDFKATQYPTEKHDRLLVDVCAMANADISGERLIVVGVKIKPSGEREILGIDSEDFRDSAIYQQLIRENLEPDLSVEYLPLNLDEGLVGVLRISGCGDPPYLLRKDFRELKRGDGFIRKGTHQTRITRADLDRMRSRGREATNLSRFLELSFVEGETSTALSVHAVDYSNLPSERAATRVREILEERRRIEQSEGPYGWRVLQNLPELHFGIGPRPYEQRSTEDLEKALEGIEDTYRDADICELLEQRASKVSLFVFNRGDQYLEDASIRLSFPPTDGLFIPDRVVPEPPKYDAFGMRMPMVADLSFGYPTVEKTEAGGTLVTSEIGDVRHGLWTPIFGEPLRLLAHSDLAGEELEVEFAIHGKNLSEAVRGSVVIVVEEAST